MFRSGFLLAALACAQAPQPEARKLIAESAAAIKKYQSYRLESIVTVDLRGARMDNHLEMPSSISVRRPDRMKIQSRSQAGTVNIVSDGEHTWFYLSALKKYVKRDAVGSPEAAVGNSGLLPKNLPDLEHSIKSTRITGEETIDVAGVKYPCWTVETAYGQILLPEQHLVIRNAVQTSWISKAEKLSLQNTFRGEIDLAGVSEPVRMSQSTRTTLLRLNPKLLDSEFVFTPPANAKETDDWTLPGIAKPDLEGKAAPAFKAGGVDLAALRGKVVLLNIGAAWCAPCRRQIALFEKLRADLPDVAIIGISVGDAPKASFPIASIDDSNDLLTALSINSYPTVIVIDRAGNIAAYEAGAQTEEALRAMLAKLDK
ncbi:MAG: DUF2092 domain-containing protein [Acidobacteriia bacterium]|nr:DUF2092 domain-containing protein [Terriglobia bacterium]